MDKKNIITILTIVPYMEEATMKLETLTKNSYNIPIQGRSILSLFSKIVEDFHCILISQNHEFIITYKLPT